MQLTLANAEGLGQRELTHRKLALDQIEQAVPWKLLFVLIEPHYPISGRKDRRPYPLPTVLRIRFLKE